MTERLHFHFSLPCIGEGNGKPLQCSCLENPRDGGAWWTAAYGVAQSWTRLKWLSSSSNSSMLYYFLDSVWGCRKRLYGKKKNYFYDVLSKKSLWNVILIWVIGIRCVWGMFFEKYWANIGLHVCVLYTVPLETHGSIFLEIYLVSSSKTPA